MKRLQHVERLSSNPEALAFVRRINAIFLQQNLTELKEVDGEWEAVLIREDDAILAVIAFYRYEGMYYLAICWVKEEYRRAGLYKRLYRWVVKYALEKGARTIELDVHHDNEGMVRISERNMEKTFVRFKHKLVRTA